MDSMEHLPKGLPYGMFSVNTALFSNVPPSGCLPP